MTLRLQVATAGAEDPRIFVGIEKRSDGAPVPFEGSYGYGRDLLAQGRLRLALRELDPVLSRPHQPEHTFRTLQPVGDGEEVEVLIPLSSSATLFRAGDSLRLMVAGRWWPAGIRDPVTPSSVTSPPTTSRRPPERPPSSGHPTGPPPSRSPSFRTFRRGDRQASARGEKAWRPAARGERSGGRRQPPGRRHAVR
ncbi:CocE/NonD family hydrolase C-terminal non-catalytic domain-containing protein [Streptomyces gramineus]|uniref:CocE/NonD family hydrolase C-terminal non-catalytic domain-containing protein n=1 Tax=Streptomyces gramineus TaxID=910542 RepID=UPI00398A76F5